MSTQRITVAPLPPSSSFMGSYSPDLVQSVWPVESIGYAYQPPRMNPSRMHILQKIGKSTIWESGYDWKNDLQINVHDILPNVFVQNRFPVVVNGFYTLKRSHGVIGHIIDYFFGREIKSFFQTPLKMYESSVYAEITAGRDRSIREYQSMFMPGIMSPGNVSFEIPAAGSQTAPNSQPASTDGQETKTVTTAQPSDAPQEIRDSPKVEFLGFDPKEFFIVNEGYWEKDEKGRWNPIYKPITPLPAVRSRYKIYQG